MTWHVTFTDAAKQDLKKLDKQTAKRIVDWIDSRLEGCSNPRVSGKGLTENLSGYWRYRIGDYRAIARLDNGTITINIVKINHRSKVYLP